MRTCGAAQHVHGVGALWCTKLTFSARRVKSAFRPLTLTDDMRAQPCTLPPRAHQPSLRSALFLLTECDGGTPVMTIETYEGAPADEADGPDVRIARRRPDAAPPDGADPNSVHPTHRFGPRAVQSP